MPAIKSASEIAAKWARVTPGRSSDFSAGVKAPKLSWETGATAAAESYKTGVTAAANEGRFEKGVKSAGDTKWQKKTVEVGVGRWAGGVSAATSDYQAGFAPFADVIQKTTLPPRYPKGDPRNYDRARQMGQALNAAKLGKSVA